MVKRAKLYTFIIFGFLLLSTIFTIDYPVSIEKVHGSYVTNVFGEGPGYVEIPNGTDTLFLNTDMSFFSNFYGEGVFEIGSGFYSNKLKINYEYNPVTSYSNNKNTYHASRAFEIKNKLFRPPKIMLVDDLNYYYRKLN